MTADAPTASYMSGFANEFATEALPGALPVGRNSPQRPPHGLYVEKFSGTETVRKIGELWVVGEGRGPMPGGEEATSVLSLGYDPQKRAFVGTWFGSMMTQLWVYEGELDAGKRKLTLNTEGPNMQKEGEQAK